MRHAVVASTENFDHLVFKNVDQCRTVLGPLVVRLYQSATATAAIVPATFVSATEHYDCTTNQLMASALPFAKFIWNSIC